MSNNIPEDRDRLRPLAVAATIAQQWRLVAGMPIAFSIITAVIVLLLPHYFTATSTFVSETPSGLSLPASLAGLASQFGVGVPGAAQSPQFYADLLSSRTLRDSLLLSRFPDPRTERGATAQLLDILEIEEDGLLARLEMGRKELEGITSVRVNHETGVVALSAETRSPRLSAHVVNRAVALVNSFNLEARRTQVRAQRQFIEGRVAETEGELEAAEENLRRFLEQNRIIRGSPQLEVEYERLQRRVTLKQEVLITLRREFEQARIQEVNNTPLITVIDLATPPVEKSSPRRTLNVVLAFMLGGLVGVLSALGRDALQRAQDEDDEDLRHLRRQFGDVARIVLPAGSRRGHGAK